MRPGGSRAGAAFRDAHRELARYAPAPGARPAVDLSVPEAPALPPPLPPAPSDATTVPGALAAQAAGEVTARELVEDALVAADAHLGLGGTVHLDPDRARAEADALDAVRRAGLPVGALHGIPLTVKDVIHVAGMPTRAGSAAFHERPDADAEGVARLRAAGAVVVGKVATHEFALGVTTPQARNPHDPGRIPGGSSGGSAIAVATGFGLGSLGTDTRASIRVPPALCGVVGLKPTYGVVPTGGVVTLSWTMDHVAPIAGTVAGAAHLLEALAPAFAGLTRWSAVAVDGMRVGVPEATFAGADPEVAALARAAVGALAELGVATVPAARPDLADLDRANAAGMVVSRAEAAVVHRHLGLDRRLYWDEVADQLAEAERLTAIDYLTAQRMRGELAAGLGAAMLGLDALVMPTTPVAAPPAEDFAAYLTVLSRNAIPWSLVGFPAMTLPCGRTSGGLPVGLQVVAPPHGEPALIALGSALEQKLGLVRPARAAVSL